MTLRKLFSAALAGGFCAGIIAAALQLWLNQPLIAAAELLEVGGHHHGHDHAHGGEHGTHISRHVLTFATNIVIFCGFGLVVAALMEWLQPNPKDSWLATGVLWGLAGYGVTVVAPTLGLPAELPGTPHSDLLARQLWWGATAICTAVGLWLAFLARLPLWRIAPAVAIILAPHIVGAPHSIGDSAISSGLAALFATRATAVSLIAWLVLGAIVARIRESY